MEKKFLNILKLFFAYCVIAIHTGLFENITPNLYNFSRGIIFFTGVPFFFLSSSYFLGRKIANAKERNYDIYITYIYRLFKPYIFWSLFYTIIEFIKDIILKQNCYENIKNLLLGIPSGAMWFLSALIVSTLIISCIKKERHLKISIIISSIIYILYSLLIQYSGEIQNETLKSIVLFINNNGNVISNVLFSAFTFVGIGFYVGRYKNTNDNKIKNIIGLFIGIILVMLEILNINNIQQPLVEIKQYIGTILIAYNIFMIGIKWNIKLQKDTKILRKLSEAIYYSHSLFNLIITFILEYLINITNAEIKFILVSIITTIFSYSILKLNNKKVNELI